MPEQWVDIHTGAEAETLQAIIRTLKSRRVNSSCLRCMIVVVSNSLKPPSLSLILMPQKSVFIAFLTQENLSFKCSLGFSPPPLDPVLEPFFSGKRIRTNRQPVATQGFSDLSLLCHKGIRSQSWPSRTA